MSGAKKCEVYVHTQMKRYCAGDMVEGTVVLTVYEPITVDRIILKWRGSAQVRMFGFKDGEKYKGKWGGMNSQNSIFRSCTEINTPRGIFNPGTFVYPFRFRLEADLTGSLPLRGHKSDMSTVRLLYRLKAEARGPDFSKAKNTQIIDVCDGLKKPIEKSHTMHDTSVSTWLCCSGGQIKMMVMLDKDAYQPGELIKATVSVDSSNCSVDLGTLVRLTRYTVIGPQQTKYETGQMLNYFHSVTVGPKVPKGSKQFINLIVPVPQDYTTDCCNIKANSRSGTDFQIVLSGSCMKNILLNVPVTIYALPALNEPLQLASAQVLPPTEIAQDQFKSY